MVTGPAGTVGVTVLVFDFLQAAKANNAVNPMMDILRFIHIRALFILLAQKNHAAEILKLLFNRQNNLISRIFTLLKK